MADRDSSFRIAFEGDAGNLESFLSALKGKFRTAVTDLQSLTSKVELFANLQNDVKKASDAFDAAKAAVAGLKAQIDTIKGAGGTVGVELSTQFRQAEIAALAASKAFNTQVSAITALQSKLTLAGVQTGNLAAEQLRLAAALKQATLAAAQQSAKDLLGFKSLGDVQPQITALTNAFNTLRASGKLSASEIAVAHSLLGEKIAAVRGQVTGLNTAIQSQKTSFSSFFTGATAAIFGFTAAIATVVSTLRSVTSEAKAFNQGVTEIGVVSNLTRAELATLAEGARKLALTMGEDVVEAVKALKEIIRGGIPADNALALLAVSAEAAKASLTDIGTTSKLSTLFVQGFGVQVADVERVLDIFFESARHGGPTLRELADSVGSLLPVAKAAHVPIEQLSAVLEVMTRATHDAPGAIADLTKIIARLDTKAAQKQLKEFGIEGLGLVDTFVALGKQGRSLTEILDIGLASKKSLTGITALANGAEELAASMKRASESAGALKRARDLLEDTPKERLEKFNAAIKDFEITVGNAVGGTSKLALAVANLLNVFNNLSPTIRESVLQSGVLSAILGPLAALIVTAYNVIGSSQSKAAEALLKFSAAATKSANELKTAIGTIQGSIDADISAVTKRLEDARGALGGFVTDIQAVITAIQTATTAGVAELNARAAAEIAALDKGHAAEIATAEASIAIQTKLAADKLALIQKSAAEVIAAFSAEAAARLAVVKRGSDEELRVNAALVQERIALLTPILAAYRASYNDLIGLAQGSIAKIRSIEAERVAFNQDIEDKIRAIRVSGLSAFDQYYDKIKQIDENISKARQAAAAGDAQLAKQYADKAIALTDAIRGEVVENGRVVVSSLETQQTKITKLGEAAAIVNDIFSRQSAAAKSGAEAFSQAADEAKGKIDALAKVLTDLNEQATAGLQLKVNIDLEGVDKAIKDIDEALAAKDHLIPIKLEIEEAQKQIDAVIAKLKAGVTEGVDAQLEGIGETLAKIVEDAPELKLDIGPATKQIDDIKASVAKINELHPKLTVDSNVPQVQEGIDNLKKPTESTHTVHIVYDGALPADTGTTAPGLARGGFVAGLRQIAAPAREAFQRFARGGFAFPRLRSIKVPGVGNTDTVPASLPSGAFVMRKAASQFYGDAAMAKIAEGDLRVRMLAGGGYGQNDRGTGTTTSSEKPKSPYIGADDRTTLEGSISPPNLPSDPKKLRALVASYAFDVAYAAYSDDFFFWKPMLRSMYSLQASYEYHPSDQNLDAWLKQARSIGLNLGYSHGDHVGFDVDGRKWHKQLARNIPPGLSGPLVYEYDFYNRGGQAGGDTVNAMLTPGEFVINAPRASALGADFLHAINDMRVPRETLAAIASPMPPPRPLPRFAEGGYVGDGNKMQQWAGPPSAVGGGVTFNLNASVADLYSIDNVRRFLLPVLREIDRRGK